MHTLRSVAKSIASWFRSISLGTIILIAASVASFAAETDLDLAFTEAPVPVVVGGELQFSLDLINWGPDSAEDVTIQIDLPAELSLVSAGTTQGVCLPGPPLICQLGLVGADAPLNLVSVTIDTVADVVTDVTLATMVESTTADPFPDNNSAAVSLSVVNASDSADLIMDTLARQRVSASGMSMIFWVEFTNDGPVLAEAVDVEVRMQELKMADYISASSSQGLCSTALDTCVGLECQDVLDQPLEVSCDLGSMASGSTDRVEGTAYFNLPVDNPLTVSAQVRSKDTADPNPSNNSKTFRFSGEYPPPPPIINGPDYGGDVGCFIQAVFK